MKIIINIVNRTLLQNKKKTFLTFVCIFSSILFMTILMIGGESLRQSYIKTLEPYHYVFKNIDSKQLEIIKNDSYIQEYYIKSEPINYSLSDMSAGLTLQQLDIHAFTKDKKFQNIKGRLPQNQNEIILYKNSHYQIGDYINLIDDEKEMKYRVVGMIDQFSYDEVQGYSLLKENKYINVYIIDKKINQSLFLHYDSLSDQLKSENRFINDELLAMNFVFGKDGTRNQQIQSYIAFSIFMMMIVVLISIMIIHFAFTVSSKQRIAYFGLLSSMGTTSKQKKLSIFYEGIVISCFAFPLAYISSLVVLKYLFQYLNQLNIFIQNQFTLQIDDSISIIMMIIFILLITLFLSLYPLARKLSKMSVIELIKNTDHVDISQKDISLPSFIQKHCSIELIMAIKNHKRHRKQNRFMIITMTISLTLITILLIVTTQQIDTLESLKDMLQYDLRIDLGKENEKEALEIVKNHSKQIEDYFYIQFCKINIEIDQECFINSIQENQMRSDLYVVNNEYFQKLCYENQIEYIGDKQALFVNGYSLYFNQDKILNKINASNINMIQEDIMKDDGSSKVNELPVFETIDIVETDNYQLQQFGFIVSEDYCQYLTQNPIRTLFIDEKDNNQIINEFKNFRVHNDRVDNENQIQIYTFIQKSMSALIEMIVVFAMTNSLNLLYIHASQRKKEFMIFKSIGITSKQLLKMIVYENLVHAVKLILYGMLMSTFLSYIGIYFIQFYFTDIHFYIPVDLYVGYGVIIIGMMSLLTIVLYRLLKKQNIIETIKQII